MDIIGYTQTRKLGKKITPEKYMTERLKKIDENNSKNEGELILVRKTRESNICDGINLIIIYK